jgi:hypothetical protein
VFQPPWDETGVLLPRRLPLVETADVLVTLSSIVAYSSGMSFTTEIRLQDVDVCRGLNRALAGLPDDQGNDTFHLVVTTDGSALTSLPSSAGPYREPYLGRSAGHGSEHQWEQGWWLTPIPRAGSLEIAVRWPAMGLEPVPVVVDGDELRAAAASSRSWP